LDTVTLRASTPRSTNSTTHVIAALVALPAASLVMVIDRAKAPHVLATGMTSGVAHVNLTAWHPKTVLHNRTNDIVLSNRVFSVTLANNSAILLPTVIC
jgi:hypothetical protein